MMRRESFLLSETFYIFSNSTYITSITNLNADSLFNKPILFLYMGHLYCRVCTFRLKSEFISRVVKIIFIEVLANINVIMRFGLR